MNKRLVTLLLTLVLLVCGAAALGEQTPGLEPARISELQSLAGEDSALWREGTAPSSGMDAFTMWQWTDWFLSARVRSLLGAIQDVEQLASGTLVDAKWQLMETENTLSRFEAQLEEDRLAILNGIELFERGGAEDEELASAYDRMLEAEAGIRQIISTICRDYDSYLSSVNACSSALQKVDVQGVHAGASAGLAADAAKLEKSENAKADFSVSALSTHQFRIRVLDANSKPLSGAAVTVAHSQRQTQTQVTNAQGDAIFFMGDLGADENNELQLSLRVEAAGWRTHEVQSVRLRGGETRTVGLQKDDGTPYLIMGCFDGRDILAESSSCYVTAENTANLAFAVKLHCDGDGEIELRYPVDADAAEYAAVVQTFSAADSDSTVLSFADQWLSKLIPGTKVSFVIRTGGEEYTTNTRLLVQKAIVDAPVLTGDALLTFPEGLNASLPADTPFIGGSSLSLEIPDSLSRTLVLPSGAAMYAIGYDFKPEQANWQTRDAEEEARAIKDFELKGKADEALAAAGAHRDINTAAQSLLLSGNEAVVTPFASMQGLYRSNSRTLELSGTAGATLAFRAEIAKIFQEMPPADFLASANLSLGTGFGVDVTSISQMDVTGGAPEVAGPPRIGYEDGKTVSLAMNLVATSGMGVRDGVKVDYYGYGRVDAAANLAASGMTASADVESGVTLRELFLRSSGTDGGNAQVSQGDFDGMREEHRPDPPSSETGSKGLEPLTTEMLFDRLDSAAGELRYAQIGDQTYAFWILPGISGTPGSKIMARLMWYNLTSMSVHGDVGWLSEGQADPGIQGIRSTFADYDFALEAEGDYCALTILSGQFSDTGSGTEPATPYRACVANVLMKINDEKGLDIIGYQEEEPLEQDGNYPILPQTCISVKGSDVSIVSSYSTSGNPQEIDSRGYVVHTATAGMDRTLRQTFSDDAEIARYRIAPSTASNGQATLYALNTRGELSRLTQGGKDVLARGEIASFEVLSGASSDRLFYLERVETETGGYAHRLRSVTSDGKQRTDYDIEIGATLFDIASLDDGVCLYWTETAASEDSSGAKRLVRCVRYDPGSDTAYGPFSLAELPANACSVGLPDNCSEGYYFVDTKSSQGSYLRLSLSRFTYGPVASAGMTAAVLTDPCVSAGDDADLVLSVKNTGNVPLSAFDVEIRETTTNALVQTLHIDPDHPGLSTSSYPSQGTGYTMTGENVLRRISGLYDALNHESWRITGATAAGSTTRSLHTGLLMPGDTHSYQTKLRIPADWSGSNTLEARIVGVTGEPNLSARETEDGLLLVGTSAQGAPTVRLGSDAARGIDTNTHDLMLSAQPVSRGGKDYIHITIRNRSGNTASSVTPVLTARYRGQTLYSHAFSQSLGDDFGYSMDIPLTTLTKGQSFQELDLYVSSKEAQIEEFADSDNHVRLQLAVQLCIVEQPVSLCAAVGEKAAFSVKAAGGARPYSYQWQTMTAAGQWKNIEGANQDTCSIESVKEEQSGLTVRCVVSDQSGDSVTSDPATLTIPLCIIEQPVSLCAALGERAVFSVKAAGGIRPYSYQWQTMTETDQWENIPGANQDICSIASVEPEQNGLTVRCVVSDQSGDSVTSDPATLSIPLCIIEQPVSIPAAVGQEAVFSVKAAGGVKPYSYQWQAMTASGQWKNIAGANRDTYSIASVRSDQSGLTVRCVVTDQNGDSVTSDPAMLIFLPQTGDSSQLTLWLLLALASIVALAVYCRKRGR